MSWQIPPDLSLIGQHVQLEPLTERYRTQLLAAASDGELWKFNVTGVPDATGIASYIGEALENKLLGRQLPFVVRRLQDNKIVGCTRFYDISPANRNLAIGHTWYAKSVQRTAINTECKFLLLQYAFEQLDCISVAFHTHHENYASQNAIARLGAHKDGVLRNHQITVQGQPRDTVCYSIIDREWGDIKARLERRLKSER